TSSVVLPARCAAHPAGARGRPGRPPSRATTDRPGGERRSGGVAESRPAPRPAGNSCRLGYRTGWGALPQPLRPAGSAIRVILAQVSHYFSTDPGGAGRTRTVTFEAGGQRFSLTSAEGVFSADRLDPGTAVLLDRAELPSPDTTGPLLDLGCG